MLIDNDMFWWDFVTVCKVNLHSMRVSLLHVTRPREAITEYIVWVLLDNLSELCRLIRFHVNGVFGNFNNFQLNVETELKL